MTAAHKITFANEDSLPKLPLPTLVSTVEQTMAAIKPLVSSDEYQSLLDKSIDFLNSRPIKIIQQHLQESSNINGNYLDSQGISPTTANVYGELRGNTLPRNPFFILENDPLKSFAPTQHFRASILATSALRFIVSLRQELLKPDCAPKSGRALSMSSYTHLFGTSIVPFNNGVSLKTTENPNDSRHIIVMARSQFYCLEVLSEDNQIWFTKHELANIIKEIMDHSNHTDLIDRTRNAVGAFTTELKTTWKYARLALEKSNKETIDVIDKALFVLCLDHESSQSELEMVQFASHGTSRIDESGIQVGTCTNRYYDKLNLIVTENSIAACVYPAAAMDGTTVLRFISDIYTDSVLRLARKINGNNYTLWGETNTVPINDIIEKPTFSLLKFNLTPELRTGLRLAETRLADIIHQHEYISRRINGFGWAYINGKMRLPPDSVIQACIQITYYALYGKMCATMEPVTTRKFKDARTEAVSVQSESMETLCQTFISQVSDNQKWTAMLNAIHEHKDKVVKGMNGKGFERHLSALRSAFIQQEILYTLHPNTPRIPESEARVAPPFLFEPALEKLYKPELLVANCGNPALHLFGVTPAIPTGFGIGYIVKDDSISFVASSQWRQTDRFLDTLASVFDEVIRVWKSVVLPQDSTAEEPSLNYIYSSSAGKETPRSKEIENYLGSLPVTLLASNNTNSTNNSSAAPKELHQTPSSILGGYDYFDVGDFSLRSELASRAHSRTITRTNSGTNLKSGVVTPLNIGKKLQINDDL